jgi:hypothetical protein
MYGGRSGRAKGKAPKGKKSKCALCDAKGHVAADCPVKDVLPDVTRANKTGQGHGLTHRTSRKAKKPEDSASQQEQQPGGCVVDANAIFDMKLVEQNPFFFFDAGCDVAATLDALAALQGSGKKAVKAYQSSLAAVKTLYGGCICRQFLKPGKPWQKNAARTQMVLDADPLVFFVVGLGPGFLLGESQREDDGDSHCDNDDQTASNSNEMDQAVTELLAAAEADDRVVGFCCKLDYSPETLCLPGYDRDTQLRRLRATCAAAIRRAVPIQCRVAPGAAAVDRNSTTGASSSSCCEDDSEAYKQVIKDLAKVLLDMTPPTDETKGSNQEATSTTTNSLLQVHLSCWNGTEAHMMHLLKAFPNTIHIGMNATVGFGKQKVAHDCAFSVPLDRLLLETDAPLVIPAPLVSAMGRKAFCHAGCIPFIAAAVAEQKKNCVAAVEVARAAATNTIKLYGRGIAERALEAIVATRRAVGRTTATRGGRSVMRWSEWCNL